MREQRVGRASIALLWAGGVLLAMVGTAAGETKVTPSITLTERYDSNVLFVQGKKVDDFVTMANPVIRVDQDNHYIKGNVGVGATASAYAKNSGLNYVAASGFAKLDVGQLTERLIHGWQLDLSDSFMYTPETPAFLTTLSKGSEVPPSIVTGMQAARANSFSNRANVNSSLALSSVVSWQASYIHQHMRFGTSQAAPVAGSFFTTTFQMLSTGPQWQVSQNDTLSANYQYVKTEFSQPGGFGGGFTTNGGTLGWTRILSPQLTASISLGLTVFPSGEVQPIQSASIDWKSEQDEVVVRYSRSVMPSFYIAGVPLMSNMIQASAMHEVARKLSVGGVGGYAKNESVPSGILEYNAFSYGPRANYKLTDSMALSLSYTHYYFETQFQSTGASFNRDVVMLTFHGEWN